MSEEKRMSGAQRRQELERLLHQARGPVSGSALARQLGVSRQVIVQDIALLRTANPHILATNQGYLIYKDPTVCTRRFKVRHSAQEIREELNLVVDLGGRFRDVSIHHKIYGMICAEMPIRSRADVDDFVEAIRSGKSQPLSNATSGYHYHLVEADSEARLDKIGQALLERGFLVPQEPAGQDGGQDSEL